MRLLERRNDAFEPAAQAEGVERLAVGRRDVFDAPHLLQPGVFRTDARIVESGGARIGFEDLAVGVLQISEERSVGTEGVSTFRSWLAPSHSKTKQETRYYLYTI